MYTKRENNINCVVTGYTFHLHVMLKEKTKKVGFYL